MSPTCLSVSKFRFFQSSRIASVQKLSVRPARLVWNSVAIHTSAPTRRVLPPAQRPPAELTHTPGGDCSAWHGNPARATAPRTSVCSPAPYDDGAGVSSSQAAKPPSEHHRSKKPIRSFLRLNITKRNPFFRLDIRIHSQWHQHSLHHKRTLSAQSMLPSSEQW